MKNRILTIYILIVSIITVSASFADVLIGTNGDYTAHDEYVNASNGTTNGEDVYFECGQTFSNFAVYNAGVNESNRSFVGAYYMDGNTPVRSTDAAFAPANCPLPTIDADYGSYHGIEVKTKRYVTIQYLEVKHTRDVGIGIHTNSNNVIVEHCEIHDLGTHGITVTNSNNAELRYNHIYHHNLDWGCNNEGYQWPGGCSDTDWGAGIYSRSNSGTWVHHNHIHDGFGEGLILGRYSDDGIAEYNLVVDNRAIQLYNGGGNNHTFRYNVAGGTGSSVFTTRYKHVDAACTGNKCPGSGFQASSEVTYPKHSYVYGNLLFGSYAGATFGTHDKIVFYNNTIVSNTIYGIRFMSPRIGSAIIKNNIVIHDGVGSIANNVPSFTDMDHNLWSKPKAAVETNAAGVHDIFGADPQFPRKTWTQASFAADLPDIKDIAIPSGSPAEDSGLPLSPPYDHGLHSGSTDLPDRARLVSYAKIGYPIGATNYVAGTPVDPIGCIDEQRIVDQSVTDVQQAGVDRPRGQTVTIEETGIISAVALNIASISGNGDQITIRIDDDNDMTNAYLAEQVVNLTAAGITKVVLDNKPAVALNDMIYIAWRVTGGSVDFLKSRTSVYPDGAPVYSSDTTWLLNNDGSGDHFIRVYMCDSAPNAPSDLVILP